jgi:hypothetical protein
MESKVQQSPRIQNCVVARYRDGRMIKGITHDFGTQKKAFHVISMEKGKGMGGGKVSEVFMSDLKAVFFVKSLEGRLDHPPVKESLNDFEEGMNPIGSVKVKITFIDGEILIGTTHGYSAERNGFFVVPLEGDSNNLRVFVIANSIRHIETWK